MIDGLLDEKLYRFISEEAPKSLEELVCRYRLLEQGSSSDAREIWLNWIIFLRDVDEAIGYVQATVGANKCCEIAYVIFADHWRQGFATEAVSVVLDVLFTQYNVSDIVALIDTGNVASVSLIEKLRFQHTETITGADFIRGRSSDEYRYVLRRESWC